MPKYALIFWLLMCHFFLSCGQLSDAPNEPSVEESLTPIIQIADTLQGSQGQIKEFHILDYFESKVPIVNSALYSEELQITISSFGNGCFRLNQPEELSGYFRIQANIINSDDSSLQAELMYQIEEKSAPTAPSDEVLIIMPLGDSMTNDSRPRVKLWNLLYEDGYELDYVGNQYQESSIPDPDHEGVGGIKIEGIMDKAELLMQTHSPRYVALMVGTNDIVWYFDETAPEIASRWKDLIDRIYNSSEPGTYILAATIPPSSSKDVGKTNMTILDRAILIQLFNTELRSYIKDRRENGDHIILADVEAALDRDKHLSGDGVHLNEAGYGIMGTVYYDAMMKALKDQE